MMSTPRDGWPSSYAQFPAMEAEQACSTTAGRRLAALEPRHATPPGMPTPDSTSRTSSSRPEASNVSSAFTLIPKRAATSPCSPTTSSSCCSSGTLCALPVTSAPPPHGLHSGPPTSGIKCATFLQPVL